MTIRRRQAKQGKHSSFLGTRVDEDEDHGSGRASLWKRGYCSSFRWKLISGMFAMFAVTALYILNPRDGQNKSLDLDQKSTSVLEASTDSTMTLRQRFESTHDPHDSERIQLAVESLRLSLPHPVAEIPYDIFDCPAEPPAGYPFQWKVLKILDNWPIQDTTIPSDYMYQGVCVFDWNIPEHRLLVDIYREAELPVVLRNHEEILKTTERFSSPGYMQSLLGEKKQHALYSQSNNFMYFREPEKHVLVKHPLGWDPPTKFMKMTYNEWLQKADALTQGIRDGSIDQTKEAHWYVIVNAIHNIKRDWLFEELPFFVPPALGQSTILTPAADVTDADRMVSCLYGMPGIFVPGHFDIFRNWITMLSGSRRYILSHYRECEHLHLYPEEHPSGRQSRIDWMNPHDDIMKHPELGSFASAEANEVVLQAGDALYLPTSWFHTIVSLESHLQCNSFAGLTRESHETIRKCGFMRQS